MAMPHPRGRDRDEVLALLATAEALIRTDQLSEAAAQYRLALAEPVLEELPTARTEVQANYGALLLHEARLASEVEQFENSQAMLAQAIDLLSRACLGYSLGQGEGDGVTAATNLALAYFQHHINSGDQTSLMSAHLALDGAEAQIRDGNAELLDWVRSVRAMLLDFVDRR